MSKIRDQEVLKEIKLILEIPEDEPIFILRAQDKIAPTAVSAYGHLVSRAFVRINQNSEDTDSEIDQTGLTQVQSKFIDDVWSHKYQMLDWQKTVNNLDKVKLPDA